MTGDWKFMAMITLCFLPFYVCVWGDSGGNVKKEERYKQFFMPFVALVYCIVQYIVVMRRANAILDLIHNTISALQNASQNLSGIPVLQNIASSAADWVAGVVEKTNPVFVLLVIFNTTAMAAYAVFKKIAVSFLCTDARTVSLNNKFVGLFYQYDDVTAKWYIKPSMIHARAFAKAAFAAAAIMSGLAVLVSCYLCKKELIRMPFYPVFGVILIGEIFFFLDGETAEESKSSTKGSADRSERITNYAILRKKLRDLFGDKVTAEGTTVNDGVLHNSSVDTILEEVCREYGHSGENYTLFIKQKVKQGLKPDENYVRSGIDLSEGKSLLFNTPFYYKLSPYVFYAMNKALLKGGKVLVVLGRHGTSDDVLEWCRSGMQEATYLPNLWKIGVLDNSEQELDIALITRSGVHDPEIHRVNRAFLKDVSFVVLIEPSKLITTAQIGLNLLVRHFDEENKTVFCSVDRNCDGLVDALSHILMTSITEVSATEYPRGVNSYMCWSADGEYLQHRLVSGISRYLGLGTELSFVALKYQIDSTVWYGGETFPVIDEHWIAKQYYHDLLHYAELPATQDTFDKCFTVSYNICNEKVRENSYITVEDESNNLFEIKRELSTISEQQGFVNVISTEYMLREYMTENDCIFTADPKAIPFFAADYARTKRNVILRICLTMCDKGISVRDLTREFMLLHITAEDKDLKFVLWNEICDVFCKTDGDIDKETGLRAIRSLKNTRLFTPRVIERKHEYSIESGTFEDYFIIISEEFKRDVLDDLQNARYIAERDTESHYLRTDLKGHILQKYLPGQFMTLNGKYYEMLAVTEDNQVQVRRAAEHITTRFSYRQLRKYHIDSAYDGDRMGMQKNVNGVLISNQFAHVLVETPAYWRMTAYNDFNTALKIAVSNVPDRTYYSKEILKLDFSSFETFDDETRVTLTLLLNEVFATLFAENQPFIAAVTAGEYESPLTYSLDGEGVSEKAIYIIEDSQLDIGLLVAVERNLERIFQIVTDYLNWNNALVDASRPAPVVEAEEVNGESESEGEGEEAADSAEIAENAGENESDEDSELSAAAAAAAAAAASGRKLTREEKRVLKKYKSVQKKKRKAEAKEAKKQKKQERKAARKARKNGNGGKDIPESVNETEAEGNVSGAIPEKKRRRAEKKAAKEAKKAEKAAKRAAKKAKKSGEEPFVDEVTRDERAMNEQSGDEKAEDEKTKDGRPRKKGFFAALKAFFAKLFSKNADKRKAADVTGTDESNNPAGEEDGDDGNL